MMQHHIIITLWDLRVTQSVFEMKQCRQIADTLADMQCRQVTINNMTKDMSLTGSAYLL
jgi:hypothetical protein